MEKEIKSIECKFIMHNPGRLIQGEMGRTFTDDYHFVKEKVTYTDNTIENRLKVIKNYERPYWITKEVYRKHKQKKEQELIDRCYAFKTTETKLWYSIAQKLGGSYRGCTTRMQVANNPYIYGCDVNSRVFLKKEYMDKYPDTFSKYEVAALDIETDIDTDIINMVSLAFKDSVYTVILKDYVSKIGNFDTRLRTCFASSIPIQNIKMSYTLVDTEIDLLRTIMTKAHELKPDFLAVWNIDFEMTKFIELCKRENVDIADIMSDPSLPKELRYFKYKKGADFRVTASGQRKPYEPREKWNVVYAPSSFHWIDPMTVYNYIRAGGKKVPTGYGLDSILGFELGKEFKKLKFDYLNTDGLTSAEWHRFMSNGHKVEYIVYNQWDVLSMLELDKKIQDLCVKLPVLSGINPFDIFNSNPKKLVNLGLFTYIDSGYVIGTCGKDIEANETLGLSGWIVTLQNNLLNPSYGKKCILENTELETNIRTHVCDSDQTSGYPSNTSAANVSKETTTRDIADVKGVPKDLFRTENINLCMGPVSSIQYCQELIGFPTHGELDVAIRKRFNI